jgi:hypothetical protein
MKKYGYDETTGALFSWEFGLQFEGITKMPEGAFKSVDRPEDEMLGCVFMSGWNGTFVVIRSDGKSNEQYCLFGYDSKVGYWKEQNVRQSQMEIFNTYCICGEVVQYPEKVADICYRHRTSRMYVCPLANELAALGVLVRNMDKMLPYRVQLAWDNKEPINAEFKEFDPKLDGDGLGRMADLVTHGLSPVNEMMTTVGVSPFYGKTLHREWCSGSRVIVRRSEVDTLFPRVPISSKNYAATSVFVKMETSEKFRELSGYNEKYIDVFVATDYVPGVSTFMRFYKTFSGRGFVFVSDRDVVQHKKIVPIFRSDRAYKVQRETYEQRRSSQ